MGKVHITLYITQNAAVGMFGKVDRNGLQDIATTNTDAIDRGREISRNQGTELIVHNQDGKFAWRDSTGMIPCPPKG
jgi:hypothetical protein